VVAVAAFGTLLGFIGTGSLSESLSLSSGMPASSNTPHSQTATYAPLSAASNTDSSEDAEVAAIKRAIQDVDGAQMKAIANKDLSPLTVAATREFVGQQKAVAQGLLDEGVIELQLVNVEWGPITVDGTNATVTAFETWTATYSDGVTEQSRERNTYTIVQQEGTWKVESDEHPDALAGGPTDGYGSRHWMPHLSTPMLAGVHL
jgi:ketosteroid isomerase-like protein